MSEDDVDVIKLFKEAALEVSGRRLDDLTLDTPLADLALDSVLVLEVVSHVEQSLAIRFEDEDLSRIQTMRDLGNLIQKARRAA